MKTVYVHKAIGTTVWYLWIIEPEFVNLLRNPGIYSQPVGIFSLESIPGLLKHLQIRALMDTTGKNKPLKRRPKEIFSQPNRYGITEPEFVNLLRSPGINSQPGGIYSLESIPGLLKS